MPSESLKGLTKRNSPHCESTAGTTNNATPSEKADPSEPGTSQTTRIIQVAGEESARSGVQYIYLGICIIQVGEINVRSQFWKVSFDLFCEWKHEKDSQTELCRLTEKWKPSWEPNIRFTNADHYKTSSKMYITFPQTGFVGYRITINGDFRMDSDLVAFPFDVQALPIVITMGRERYSKNLLHHEVSQFRHASNHANMIMTQTSDEYRFRPLRYMVSKTSKSAGVDGRAMSQFRIVAPVRRMSFYYVVNHYMPTSVIQTMSFGIFAIRLDHEGIYERMMLLVTAFVVLAAFKFQMAAQVPRVPEMTHLDKYMFCSFMFIFAISIYACVSCYLGEDMDGEIDGYALSMAVSAWLLQQIFFSGLAHYYMSLWPKQIQEMGTLDPQARNC